MSTKGTNNHFVQKRFVIFVFPRAFVMRSFVPS